MKGRPKHRAVKSQPGFATRAIHAGQNPDPATGAVVVPIYQTSTYVQRSLGEDRDYAYARGENPTRRALEKNVAALEGGLAAHAFASGMAAISALMKLLRPGDHVIATHGAYGGTYRLFTTILERAGFEFSWVRTSDPTAVKEALRKSTRMIYLESPTNPLLEITDLERIVAIAHERGVIVAVDNTFLTPYLQSPLELGADLAVHSTTKYLNGHSDSLGGVVVSKRAEHAEWIGHVQKSTGGVLAPFEAFLILRGIKTLAVRMRQHEENAERLALFLDAHPKIAAVYYPGLESHPGHSVQARQARGFGAMISVRLGSLEKARRFVERLEVMTLAESLGGVESLVSHPATMSNAAMSKKRRAELGVHDDLVRISVGIEDGEDLENDVERALNSA